jgi:serine/threonine protein kinase
MMNIRPGDTVLGNTESETYEVIKPIGSGQFGIVYELKSPSGDSFALKTIVTAWLNPSALNTLINEGHLAMEIQHPHVLRVFFFNDGKQYAQLPPYMIMEFADGGTLEDMLDHRRSDRVQFEQHELVDMFRQLALAMRAINAKLVHRDIKPSNILLCDRQLKVSDFGLSKVVGSATRSHTFKGINHIRYCAPEAWQLEKNTASMDMYSMGIVFYELATLAFPYDVQDKGDVVQSWKNAHMTQASKDPREHNGQLSPVTAQIIEKMISKRPKDRYQSWDEVLLRLEESEFPGTPPEVKSLVELARVSRNGCEWQTGARVHCAVLFPRDCGSRQKPS